MALTKVDKSLLETTSGTADATTFLRGDGAWASAAAGFFNVQTPSTGTYTKTTGTNKIIVEVQAGGGGAGDSNSTWGGCGGGGAYAKQYIDVSAISTATVAVGAAGTGGTAPTAGGTSSFVCTGVSISCTGGQPGTYNVSHGNGGEGGVATATGAHVIINGQNGGASYSDGGQGGDSGLGRGGNQRMYNTTAGTPGTGYGGGGGAGVGTSTTGADGSAGIVSVWEYK